MDVLFYAVPLAALLVLMGVIVWSIRRHREVDVRLAAVEELSRALGDTLGYYADGPEADREAAARRWEQALQDPQRARRLAAL